MHRKQSSWTFFVSFFPTLVVQKRLDKKRIWFSSQAKNVCASLSILERQRAIDRMLNVSVYRVSARRKSEHSARKLKSNFAFSNEQFSLFFVRSRSNRKRASTRRVKSREQTRHKSHCVSVWNSIFSSFFTHDVFNDKNREKKTRSHMCAWSKSKARCNSATCLAPKILRNRPFYAHFS